ncbi:nitrite reductase (NAD(P)H) small subunit [Dyella monticola]|uniref:Nitrite reductase (NAD(P)H) small subunit n=1 Tax=Dyella monticola TaxID=1927958 RepID=A0A370X857_9GAMM|nr:nitrite reductase small subunit NirD [Dyella monticola]RDS84546.1 nitrite reductase (NAD(P)H) small subunit [Dyella monticola]
MEDTVTAQGWILVCELKDIVPNTGVCALIDEGQVAIFRVGEREVYALDNYDPNANASVLSRGLIGTVGGRLVVASPLYKQHFDLRTGECLQAPEHSVRAWQVKLQDECILLGPPLQ